MKALLTTASLLSAGLTIAGLFAAQSAEAATFRVSQESSAGVGDFDSNVLGFIDTYETTDTIADFYAYAQGFGGSFNGPISLNSDTSHLFLVEASDSLGLFSVHDRPQDIGGGSASMQFDLVGANGSIAVADEVGEVAGGPATLTTLHGWGPCCTDGVAFDIDHNNQDLEIFIQFTSARPLSGLSDWLAMSGTGEVIGLDLEIGRRVRLDKVEAPEPGSIVGLLALVALGGTSVLKRKLTINPDSE